jgi:hypothetical protein
MSEPPPGIEPGTYALREAREYAAQPLPAQTARRIALHALIPLELRDPSFHDPFHAGLYPLGLPAGKPSLRTVQLACT